MGYRYQAYTLDKKIVQGTIEAPSESAAEDALYHAGYNHILSLKELPTRTTLRSQIPFLFGVKTPDLIDFARQLATLIESGIPLLTALRALEGNVSKSTLSDIISRLIEELQGGSSFSEALARYPDTFPPYFAQVIKASEQTGTLETGLKQVANSLEKQVQAKKKIRRAMTYPSVIVVMAIGVIALLITVVLPPLIGLFTSLDAELPITTKILLAVTGFLVDYKLVILVVVLVIVAAAIIYLRLPGGRLAKDRFLLKSPLIGPITVQHSMFYFCQTTSMMLQAGLQLPQIMEIVNNTIGNQIVRESFVTVREKLIQGQGLSQPMSQDNLFPDLMIKMVVVGETTGTMDSTLATLADYYEQRVDQRVNALIGMIEPTLTVIIGLMIAFLATSIIMPMYSIMGSLS
jgi:type IV pilus assembly protein PilC